MSDTEQNTGETQASPAEAAIETIAVSDSTIKIMPTAGRIVWFYPTAELVAALGLSVLSDEPMASQVVHVNDPRNVNLAVTDHSGRQFAVMNIPLLAGPKMEVDEVVGSHATWMGYQLAQAGL